MKKLTLSVALLASALALKAQDTTCTYFTGKEVYEFDYYADTVLYIDRQYEKYYSINIKKGDVLCLHLSDRKNRLRKVTIEYSDGEVVYNVLNSKEYVYYTKPGAVRVRVSKPRLLVLGKSDR